MGELEGPIGRDEEYKKALETGKLITDPSTFDFDEELRKPAEEASKYHQILEFGDYIVEESYKNSDKFRVINIIEESMLEVGEELKPTKIYCSECLDIHTIGKFIVFPGWDYIVYFNTKTGKAKTIQIR